MNIEEKFWILVSRNLAHEANEAERMELEKIMNDHPVYRRKYDAHVSYWNANHKLKNTAVEHALQRTWDKIEEGSAKEVSIERHSSAALKYMLKLCAALIIGFSFY